MIYLSLLAILGVAYLIDWLEGKSVEKQTRDIEELHRNAYRWVDEHTEHYAVARERKAQIDTLIKNCVESQGRTYRPKGIRQVTTEEEREERNEATRNGKQYHSEDMVLAVLAEESKSKYTEDDVWECSSHTDAERRERFINRLMRNLDISRAEAIQRADTFYAEAKRN